MIAAGHEPGTLDDDVVRLPLAAAGIPGCQEMAWCRLDQTRGVIVLVLGRENRLSEELGVVSPAPEQNATLASDTAAYAICINRQIFAS